MFDVFCLWLGRITFFISIGIFLLFLIAKICDFTQFVANFYSRCSASLAEKEQGVRDWLEKKNFKNFKWIYFNMFNFPRIWWWRPCYRIWRIIRNTWINKKYYEFLEYTEAHKE